ncbi:MAG: heme exporter protein CcmB [Dongiaceae bacterium]
MIGSLAALVRRDLALALRQGSDAVLVVAFFAVVTLLFPFGVGPEPRLLARIAPGILWATALLSALLSFDRLFQADQEDGSLDQLALAPPPLGLVALAKVLAHWLATGLPLILAAPLLGLLLQLPGPAMPMLMLALLLGTPTLSLIGAVGAALVLGARRGAVLLPFLVLPLAIPVLIFGVAAVDAAVTGVGTSLPPLALLGGMLLAAIALAPWAVAAALRQALA